VIHRRYVQEHATVCAKEAAKKDAYYERGKAYGFSSADRLLHDALDGDVALLSLLRPVASVEDPRCDVCGTAYGMFVISDGALVCTPSCEDKANDSGIDVDAVEEASRD
jgi:hypothetical protein